MLLIDFEDKFETKNLHKMYFLNRFCCICMNKSDLKHMFDVDNDGVSNYNKLTSSIAEMNFIELNDQKFICGECCVTLNTVYNFRQMCLRSKTNLITYISQLQTFSHVSGTLSVRLKDIKHKIEVIKEVICIKYEINTSSSSFEESNPFSEFKTESYEESIQFPSSVKVESEDSSAHEDDTVDDVNEGAHSDVKVKVEHQTMMEDEPYILHSEIDIVENPLAVVKEEPTSDSETPQDGSTRPRPHKCEVCEKSFNRKENFNIHMRIHFERKPYTCDICNKGFARRRYLPRHMRMHTGEKPYECELCKKKFADKNNLIAHMRIHSGERPYVCQLCEKSFNRKGNFNIHMRTHSKRKPYACDICKKGFGRRSDLHRHMRLHTGEKPYECEVCKKKFSDRSNLATHMRIHSVEKTYKCEVCKKSFKDKCDLTAHIQSHAGEKPYACQVCEKSFYWKKQLMVHMQIHPERKSYKPYTCDICNKGFTRKRYLPRHMRMHTGEKPYECEVCKKKFASKNNLTTHMRIHENPI